MTSPVECGGSPPLLPPTRSSPGVARMLRPLAVVGFTTCHPERAFPQFVITARSPRASHCHPVRSERSVFRPSPDPSPTCYPDRSVGVVCQRGAEGSQHNLSVLPPPPPPDPCSVIPAIIQAHLSCPSRHNPIFQHHSLLLSSTIYRVTTYPPVKPSRCYSYSFRLAQHGITQCRGGHA
jgi:hypothetical protein